MFFGKTTFISIWRRYFTALANDTVWGEGGGMLLRALLFQLLGVTRANARPCSLRSQAFALLLDIFDIYTKWDG